MISSWVRRYRIDMAAIGFIILMALDLIVALHGEVNATGAVTVALLIYLASYDAIRGRITQYYVLWVWGDVEPELKGPYESAMTRDMIARGLRLSEGPDEGGIYWMNVDQSGRTKVGAYTGDFLNDAEESGASGEELFRNYYRCPKCNEEWADTWSATCDDDCAECGNRHISPYASMDVNGGADESALH